MRIGCVCLLAAWVAAGAWAADPPPQTVARADAERWVSMMNEAQRLRDSGAYAEAYRAFQQVAVWSKSIVGPPVLLARAYEAMGSTASSLGRPMDAESHYEAAIRIWSSMGAEAEEALLQARADLITLCVESGQTGRAGRLAQRLEADSDGRLAPGSLVEGRVATALAAAGYANQDAEQAERWCRRAVAVKDSHPELLPEERSQAHNQLALILWMEGRRTEARAEARTSTQLLEKLDRVHSLDYAAALGNLAMMRAAEHTGREELAMMRRAIAVVRAAVGTEHVFLGDLLTNYADLLQRSKHGGESKAARREAQAVYANTLARQPARHTVDVADLLRGDRQR